MLALKSVLIFLQLAGLAVAGEWCKNFRGIGRSYFCMSSYCCGDDDYQYCCTSCEKRYPAQTNCPNPNASYFGRTMTTMRITWIVIGVILAVKGIVALIYFCCCRRNRQSTASCNTTQPMEVTVNVPNGSYPAQVDAPPSYDDLVKDGILNSAFHCEAGNTASADPTQPVVSESSGLPPPPPYCVTSDTQPAPAAPPVTSQHSGTNS